MTTELLFDLESTGLLRQGSTIHCIVMRDLANVDEIEVFDYQPERAVIQGVKALERADVLVGHNIVCLLYTSPSPRDLSTSRMPSSA